MRLRAKMTFHNRGAFVHEGEEFHAHESDAHYLMEQGFAEQVETHEKSIAPTENKSIKKRKEVE